MTKETKIGLLVGLAFIVLFAIILSERGTAHRDSKAPAFAFMDQSKKSSNVASDHPLGDMGRVPVETQLPPIVRPSTTRVPVMSPIQEERVVQATPRDDEPLEELPADLVNSLNLPRVVDPLVQETPVDSATRIAQNSGSATPPVGSPAATPGNPVTSPASPGPASALPSANTTLAAGSSPPTASKEELERIAKQVGIRVRTHHEVQPGESLGKIAAKHFGRSTPARVDAIYEANRDVLKNKASVRAGTSLKIPDLGEGFEPAPEFVLNKEAAPVKPGAAEPARAGRTTLVDAAPSNPRGASASPESALRIPVPIRERGQIESIQLASSRPPVDPAERREEDRSTDAKAKGERTTKPMAYRWYEVQKNDTLSRIARREMGAERYVKTLMDINQDLLKNRHSLKIGMKIRVPAKVAGSSELNVQSAKGAGGDEP